MIFAAIVEYAMVQYLTTYLFGKVNNYKRRSNPLKLREWFRTSPLDKIIDVFSRFLYPAVFAVVCAILWNKY
jgi:hypothetical protein